ncbi:MCP four helix bundle domain-containing protein [Aetokthonos hydrillicola]|uniref:MCP four helix bundle domain-containing protein n=1 Tax=Aetokthonos hydrillicola TaxID=1550245 RepID=UPI001ABB3535
MMKNLSLQNKLSASFLLLGAIVLLVGTIGYISNVQLSFHIRDLAQDSLPSIDSLWQINQGLTQIQSSEETLINPKITLDIRGSEVLKIQKSFEQVQQALDTYNSRRFDDDDDEKRIFNAFVALYKKWHNHHKEFMRIYRQYEIDGFKSQDLLEALSKQEFTKNKPALEATTRTLIGLLNKEREEANLQQKSSTIQAHTTTLWLIITVLIGTGLSIILGIVLSRNIAKPISRSLRKIVNSIFILSEEITNVIGRQELMANQQAVSVNQTTITMDEMSTFSQESARQADA